MTRIIRYIFLCLLIGVSGRALSQEISGTVVDQKKESVIGAVVEVYQGGIKKGGTITDMHGKYSINPLELASNYMVVVKGINISDTITGVIVSPDKITVVDIEMRLRSKRNVIVNSVLIPGY